MSATNSALDPRLRRLKRKVRAFIACAVSAADNRRIDDLIEPIKLALRDSLSRRAFNDMRWTAPRNRHMTWVFLGDTNYLLLTELWRSVRSATAGATASTIAFDTVGGFPSPQGSKLLAIEASNVEPIQDLQQSIRQACLAADTSGELTSLHNDVPFRPHITLARLRQPLPSRDFAMPIPLILHMDNVTLFSSQLTENGSHYHELDRVDLHY